MTKFEAEAAMENHTLVEGGEPGTDDYDTGYILEITDEDTAIVVWRSGTRTPYPINDLAVA
jgi:hypothetical protein